MATGYRQFRTKAEAEQAIADMEARAVNYERHAKRHPAPSKSPAGKAAADFRTEAERIRSLIPSLPDVPAGCGYCHGLTEACPACFE